MPLFYISCALLLGIAASGSLPWPALIWLAAATAFSIWGFAAARQGGSRLWTAGPRRKALLTWLHLNPAAVPPELVRALPLLMAAAFCLGTARALAALPEVGAPGFIASYNDLPLRYTVTGVLSRPPEEREGYDLLRVEVESIRPASGFEHEPVEGTLLARVDPYGGWRYGDRVVLTGYLETPFEGEDFSYRDVLARQGVYSVMGHAETALLERSQRGGLARLFALRARLFDSLHAIMPDPEASLLAGILLGLDAGLPPGLQEAFRATGTSHIIAISGFNISLVAAVITSLFGRLFGRKPGALAAAVAVGLYTVMVGADAAVLRAAVMGVLAIAARGSGRSPVGLNGLALAAALMAFANPLILGDPGFQLSFTATLGLVLYADPLARGFAALGGRYLRISVVRRALPWVSDALLLTLAAQIATLPVIAYQFGRISLTAFIVNPLVLPVQPPLMVLGGLAAALGLVWLPLGRAAALVAYPFAAFTVRVVELFGGVPGGSLVLGRIGRGLVLSLLGIPTLLRALPGLLRAWRPELQTRKSPGRGAVQLKGLVLASLVLLSAGAWRARLAAPDGLLRVVLLDVGTGDALLVQAPGGERLLIDGGDSPVRLSDQLGRRLAGGGRRLDWLVLGGAGEGQIGGLPPLLERYSPSNILLAIPQDMSLGSHELQEIMNNAQVSFSWAASGQVLDLGRGAALEVAAITSRGAVLLLRYGDFRLLLPVGADFESLELDLPPVSALLLAESGYGPLNPRGWIERLAPRLILLSVEKGNGDGLPSDETLKNTAGYPLLRTDINGWIEVATDGRRMWVRCALQ